mgnify:CR=1 FL=1
MAEARNGREALELNATHTPDALFLDVQMPEVDGLSVAASLPDPAPAIVFVTAFDHYALPAFDAAALDYLLKPADAEHVARAVQRLLARGTDAPGRGATGAEPVGDSRSRPHLRDRGRRHRVAGGRRQLRGGARGRTLAAAAAHADHAARPTSAMALCARSAALR